MRVSRTSDREERLRASGSWLTAAPALASFGACMPRSGGRPPPWLFFAVGQIVTSRHSPVQLSRYNERRIATLLNRDSCVKK